MKTKACVAGLLPVLMLIACDPPIESPGPGPTAGTTTSGPTSASDAPATPGGPPPGYTDGSGVNEGYPDLTPPRLTPEAEKGAKGARKILLSFARAIELKEFDQAWAMLSPGDRQKWPKAEFNSMFAGLDPITVAIPDGEGDAGAGSLFYIAPVTITSSDADGRPIRFEGEARLRRVNDVDGATPEQLRWHFETLTLDWTH